MKKSFFGNSKVVITALFGENNIEGLQNRILTAVDQGAQGIAVELGQLPLELRTKENYRKLMETAPDLPFMFILYRNDVVLKNDDEARQKYLIEAAECGCEVVDVMGDLFDPEQYELAVKPEAIAKQKALIEKFHSLGAKVVMSSHMPVFRKPEEVLAHLQEQSSRGADILKIVICVNTDEEFVDFIRTIFLLKKNLTKPFIFLCNGVYARLARFIGAKLGVSITFGIPCEQSTSTQPTIEQFTNVLQNIHWPMPKEIAK